MNRRLGISVAAAVVVVVAIALGTPRVLRRLSFFRVRQVEVVGNRYLDEALVAQVLALPANASTFDPLIVYERRVARIPGVLRATVERRLPGTIRVTVHEAMPVALAPASDRLVLIDSAGKPLPFDPLRRPASLPIASRDAITASLLSRVMRADPDLYAAIESAHTDHDAVVLDLGAHRIVLPAAADEFVLQGVAAVQSYLDGRQQAWRELDARFKGRVFVRKGAA